ncbi:MAG: M48 family metallopeptidase, partial [Ferrovum sp.]|nr:M48 family metallopeptidase [Ferrovum sp.]
CAPPPSQPDPQTLWLNTSIDRLESALIQWYSAQALPLYQERVAFFARQLGLTATPSVALSNARQRWGSCSSAGRIRLNWRLLKATSAEMDYVIAHEVAHLKHMNHSPRFWATVAQLYPDFQEARRSLRQHTALYQQF